MVASFLIRHFLTDNTSLSRYLEGEVVSVDDVKRSLMLAERSSKVTIPDQYYRLSARFEFEGLDTLNQLMFDGFFNLADHYFEKRKNLIYVKGDKFNSWQSVVPFIPPLVLQSIYWYKKFPLGHLAKSGLQSYIESVIKVNCEHTAIPKPNIEQVDNWVKKKKGLNDLHIHLNGSTEVDIAWQDFLSAPDKVYAYLSCAIFEGKVVEQMEQEFPGLTANKLLKMLRIAQDIRQRIFEIIFYKTSNSSHSKSPADLLRQIVNGKKGYNSGYKHPFRSFYSKSQKGLHDVCAEGMMYVLVWREIENNNTKVGLLFHFYLLILGVANRLLVQQIHQYGFEQFQKITLNRLREYSEEKFKNRFFQMHGNDLSNIKYLEARFSPKRTEVENYNLIDNIMSGWKKFCDAKQVSHNQIPKMGLVAHFIKKADTRNANIRHRDLRRDVWGRAKVLANMWRRKGRLNVLCGVDAAASEFDTTPEVFAPAFRFLRRKGVNRFTYHAGEDFYHIVSGLRAIFEAVNFCGLTEGDRIGHAVAAGINVRHWLKMVGDSIYITKGEWIDNLVFTYYFISQFGDNAVQQHLLSIEKEINIHAVDLYNQQIPVADLITAWLSRKWDPEMLLSKSMEAARRISNFDWDEWLAIKKINISANERKLIDYYHSLSGAKRGNEIIIIEPDKIINSDIISKLQVQILKFLFDNKIAIEVLPTSNIRIGYYDNFADYHIWRWKDLLDKGQTQVPGIVVGTDDTGIFATNIFNEYAHLYCCLRSKSNSVEALRFLQVLDNNSEKLRFSK